MATGGRRRSSPGLAYLDPVWLLSDHLEELIQLLSELGETRILVEGAYIDDITQLTLRQPFVWLRLLVPAADVSVTLHPAHVTVAWADEWHPAQTERDVVSEVIDFLKSRRHPLYCLQKTEWQVVAVTGTLPVLLLAATLYVSGRPNLPLTSLGIVCSAVVLVWIIVGRFGPGRKHLALPLVGQREVGERTTRWALIVVAAVLLLMVGFLIGPFVGWTPYFWPPG